MTLEEYNRGSGQLVNKQKSVVFFSSNCLPETKQELVESLEIQIEAVGEWYLGLPTAVGVAGDGTFDYVADRVRNFVSGWGDNTLSCAARETLLKANAQAIPTYPMACFKLPPKVCKKIKSYISNYWWGSSIDNHKIHWQRWSLLTRSKAEGGMGFRDLPLFNKAMLGKQGWRLITRPNSLCSKVIKGKYYPHATFMTATRRKKTSQTWKAMLWGCEVLKKGLIKRIGQGSSVDVWEHNWIQGISSMKPRVRLPDASVTMVSELFVLNTRIWDEQLVRDTFIHIDAEKILRIRPGVRLSEDVDAWSLERHGQYSVRSAYRLLKDEQISREEQQADGRGSSVVQSWWKRL
ncbi:hypothetical protein PR202_gb16590 [Eleusine coracana subsp. coracana]|uniref:Uncharacterized protein n=1 Tax=Eleusine coracana subsp. coracana TaxID=191504 RepID=A0AAV5F196_ELECO|nr:hypothetical protein PR202_gb16590 [Eleusine coracana subsp. coracana]